MSTPYKVAILGGGLGALAAAHTLSDPSLNGRYEITLHQMGWRLGGKAATGRNAERGERIEEHGLHMMMGFYDHVFRVMRSTYAEWNPPSDYQIRTIEEAFLPQREIVLAVDLKDPDESPEWAHWSLIFPQLPGEPGTSNEERDDHPLRYLVKLVKWMVGPARELGAELIRSDDDPDARWKGHAIARAMTSDKHEPHHTLGLLKELEELWKWVETEVGETLDEVEGWLRQAWILLRLGYSFARGILIGRATPRSQWMGPYQRHRSQGLAPQTRGRNAGGVLLGADPSLL